MQTVLRREKSRATDSYSETLLLMHDRLERASTPWEKADIREEIRRYNARHDASPRDADDGSSSGANRH